MGGSQGVWAKEGCQDPGSPGVFFMRWAGFVDAGPIEGMCG